MVGRPGRPEPAAAEAEDEDEEDPADAEAGAEAEAPEEEGAACGGLKGEAAPLSSWSLSRSMGAAAVSPPRRAGAGRRGESIVRSTTARFRSAIVKAPSWQPEFRSARERRKEPTKRFRRRGHKQPTMLAHLACADAVERHRPVTLEASLDSMGRESYPASAHLEFFAVFERHLDAGRLTKAKKHLARMPPDLRARQYNAAGLLSLLEGNLASAMSFLRRADSEPFGPAHLAIRKNLYWLAYRDPEAADDNERIDSAWSAVMSAFERSHDAGMPSKDVSMFDIGIQRRICNHAMYDRNRHATMWEGVSEAERWRVQYLELVKKAVTDYLHRDLTEEFRDSSEPASRVSPAPLRALRTTHALLTMHTPPMPHLRTARTPSMPKRPSPEQQAA